MSKKTHFITYTAILAAISFVLHFIEFPLPLTPGFLKLDLSDIPALIGGLLFSPLAGVAIEVAKNLLHLFRSQTSGVGELANLLIGIFYVLPATLIIRKSKTNLGVLIGILTATLSMTILAALMNYFVILPFYTKFMPMDAIVKMGTVVNPNIKDVQTLILYGITPFNIVKGIIISVFSYVLYKKLSPMLKLK